MNTKTKVPCSLSKSFMSYGLFSVFSQLVFIILNVNIMLGQTSSEVVTYINLPYLEYPLASLALVIGGALLFDYVTMKDIS